MRSVSLDDKYTARSGRIYLSGTQALVRLLLVQRWRDEAAGLETGGFVSGYRGSPLGGLDEALWKAERFLGPQQIRFQPGVNEELAATAVWGTQQLHLVGESEYDGVFGLWYGKAPGVDRCVDVFKHASHAGTSRAGGVLLVAGDDHGAYSSTLPNQSDHVFAASMVPVLYPCNVQEYIELGVHGYAMSRYSGCVVGFKALADTVESSASIEADPFATRIVLPPFPVPDGGMHARLSTDTLGVQARKQEALMHNARIYAAMAYSRANQLNRVVLDSPMPRLGIVASGKSYLDVMEALAELGIDPVRAAEIGIRLLKVAMPWPLESEGVRRFAQGLEEILVVEEKRQIVEYQLKEQLYNWREDVRPRVVGKFDEDGEWTGARGNWLLPATADFSVAQIARVIAARIARFHTSDLIRTRLALLDAKTAMLDRASSMPPRPAYYCSGCPHNSSTRVPEGSLALAGIGCHVMATAIYPEHNRLTTQMGGEGVPWIGQAAFSRRKHVFANLGDGTYFHSGYLAIRAAVAAGVNITYKILYNDAVAMTGGQPVDGQLSAAAIARQMAAEGVRRIALVTEDTSRYRSGEELPAGTTVAGRAGLDAVQRELRELPGVSVLIYDQTCAAEKRRRRRKGEYPDPPRRLFINEAVCEGCGDCGEQSNCTSLMPTDTPLGRKRQIDQSSCNKDYTCANGFCPSFVTVLGGSPRKRAQAGPQDRLGQDAWIAALPQPEPPTIAQGSYNIYIAGIGGTGVITIGALLGMAAHLEGRPVSVLDMTGMSQKNGSVMSHVRIGDGSDAPLAQRIPAGEADLLLGCDMLTAGAADAVSKTRAGRTHALLNTHQQPSGHFARQRDWEFPAAEVIALLEEATAGQCTQVDATRLATALLGDSIATNLFMLGHAFQQGRIPLSAEAIERAIELNGAAVKTNLAAFAWGRRAVVDLPAVQRAAFPSRPVVVQLPQTLDSLLRHRTELLTAYQNEAYARDYQRFVERVREAERHVGGGTRLTRAVAVHLARLMAYKDEYEVARLYTDPAFEAALREAFDGEISLRFNLAPPLLARRDSRGHLVKREFGAWLRPAFAWLAGARRLRGTALDIFGRTQERRTERALIGEYRAHIEALLPGLTAGNLDLAVLVANVPERIRGFGHVKEAAIHDARARWQELLQHWPGNGGDAVDEIDAIDQIKDARR